MKRNNLDIEADILDLALTGIRKTRIVYGANLNFNIVKKYISGLINRGFLEYDDKLYTTTPNGKEYMNQINAIQVLQ